MSAVDAEVDAKQAGREILLVLVAVAGAGFFFGFLFGFFLGVPL